MSIDPRAGIVAGNADLAALIDAELMQLAGDAQALRALLVENAVVTARVLPSNGLTDLLEIAGRRVAASLPPTVRPGDVLQVRVAGFDGDRILLQIVDTGADAAVETGPAGTPVAPPPSAFVAASIVPATPAPPAPVAPAAVPLATVPPASASTAAVPQALVAQRAAPAAGATAAPAPRVSAPSGSVPVVAAEIVDNEATAVVAVTLADLPPAAPSAPPPGAGFSAAVLRANVAPQAADDSSRPQAAAGASPRAPIVVAPDPTSIEARMATARATVAQALPRAAVPPAVATAPAIAARGTVPTAIPPPRASGLSAYTEPVALLRALRLPVTPSNVAAATTALARPDRLPAALTALERALPAGSDDPQVATLRTLSTLLTFVGRIDPRSPALAAQIAAFVDHVVDGAEPKIATLLAATRAAAPEQQTPPSPPPAAAAVAAERGAALSVDLKQTLLAVAADPATPASLAPSLAGALTALTAVQLNAAQTLAAHPDGIAFTLPLVTEYGAASARISVKRDAPQGRGVPVDPANFRIAFVLDTIHYGTVAIDLVTVGREVTVDVRTEAAPAMRAFRDALGGLTTRLESLRYRVAAAGASVGTTSTIAVEAPPSQPLDPQAAVDRSA